MNWSGRLDSNQRPPAPKAGALPGCATPRLVRRSPGRRRTLKTNHLTSGRRADRPAGEFQKFTAYALARPAALLQLRLERLAARGLPRPTRRRAPRDEYRSASTSWPSGASSDLGRELETLLCQPCGLVERLILSPDRAFARNKWPSAKFGLITIACLYASTCAGGISPICWYNFPRD